MRQAVAEFLGTGVIAFAFMCGLASLIARGATRKARPERHAAPAGSTRRPFRTVTVQLPLYNEGSVALDLLRAVCALDYPNPLIDIQVLDDSTDNTPDLLAPEIEAMRALGHTILYLRRSERIGWKAGALAAGLQVSKAEFVAIFDADFTPPSDFLMSALAGNPAFDDASVAFLQGRWTFRNEGQSALTRAQALLLDWQFLIQKPSIRSGRLSTMFNGSAGIWRRKAIEDAGGWQADTLAEDLDLSLRAELAGGHGVYDEFLACPSELPTSLLSYRLQQRRWAKGTAQCLRKILPEYLRQATLRQIRSLAAAAGLALYPLLLAGLLLWPMLCLWTDLWLLDAAGMAIFLTAFALILSGPASTAAVSGRMLDIRTGLDILTATGLTLGSLPNNAVAILAGLLSGNGVFERTPKSGSTILPQPPHTIPKLHPTLAVEIAVATQLAWMAWSLVAVGHAPLAWPSLIALAALASVIAGQIIAWLRALPKRG